MVLADGVRAWPWPAQFVFYGVAGVAWVVPVRVIMVWGLTPRG